MRSDGLGARWFVSQADSTGSCNQPLDSTVGIDSENERKVIQSTPELTTAGAPSVSGELVSNSVNHVGSILEEEIRMQVVSLVVRLYLRCV